MSSCLEQFYAPEKESNCQNLFQFNARLSSIFQAWRKSSANCCQCWKLQKLIFLLNPILQYGAVSIIPLVNIERSRDLDSLLSVSDTNALRLGRI